MSVTKYDQDMWFLMKAFLKEKGLVKQHLDSYNHFIEYGLQEIANEIGEIPIEIPEYPYKIKLGEVEVLKPRVIEVDGSEHPVYPMEARLRNLAYAAPVYINLSIIVDGKESMTESVYIGDIPVMLKSNICPLSKMSPDELVENGEDSNDCGGYFIVNGAERVIVALEDLAPNRILVDVDNSGTHPAYKAKVFSTTVGFRARIELELKSDGGLYVNMPGVPTEIPFIVIMKALGMESDKELVELVSYDSQIQDQLEISFEKALGVISVKDAVLYIGNRVAHGQVEEYRLKKAETIVDRNFLSHIGRTPEKRHDKALFLGEMAVRVIELKLGLRKEDDKDHYANKRLKLAGSLMADLFRMAFRNLTRDVKYQLERMNVRKREGIVVAVAVRPSIITERVQHALATGNWGRGKVGTTQLLDRTNHNSTLSHLRRLQSPLSRSQPNFEARDLHPTHWGRLCPNETPEGSNCGLVKNLALMASTSVEIDSSEVKQLLFQLGMVPYESLNIEMKKDYAKIFIDGSLTGYSNNPEILLSSLKKERRKGDLSSEINFVHYLNNEIGVSKEIYINCDAGRVRRPLIIVDNGFSRLKKEHIEKISSGEWKWDDLVKNGVIEYLDSDEEENTLVALNSGDLTLDHTHLEIAPYSILGISTSIIPFAEHNQSPRNSYEAAMAKQALGIYSINFSNRVDSRAHLLHYPQKPVVRTKPMESIGYEERPSGQNAVVAVISFEGYNMEDALIFNKSSVERGLFRSSFFRIYESDAQQYLGGLKDKFELPEAGIRGFRGEQFYRLLEEDGIVSPEAQTSGGDVLIGKTSPPRFLEEYKEFEVKGPTRRDTSVSMRPAESGTVDSVFITESSQGNKLVKVKVRDQRIPELGDKFASRHGQKGVIGMLIPQEDMPFTEQGVVPDIIINPHAIPSRMTIGHFIESLAGKTALTHGEFEDGTPFSHRKQDQIRETLKMMGYLPDGREVMYNGMSGEKLVADIFIGVVYYQKLHHMVADKMHARARGQVQMLTRQPTEGRARGGGLRFGEMERDCLIGHGAAMLLKDRLLEESDKSIIHICEKCGYLAYFDLKQRKYVCKICGEEAQISTVAVSYAFKLLVQEMMSLCVASRIKLKERA
jgi:DNA-directed RNA polymerase subunit B